VCYEVACGLWFGGFEELITVVYLVYVVDRVFCGGSVCVVMCCVCEILVSWGLCQGVVMR